ncbi:MAG: hypothetical protein MI674_04365, partial [Cytophagales bacterium]|nr:hypothetical protein [Cytophagales bacterium]
TDPSTGCTAMIQVEVEQDVTQPGATAGVSGLLTCTTTSVTLEGASSTSGVAYSWEGPNAFTSLEQNPLVSVPGLYTLTVTNPTTGCTSTAQVEVEQDVTEPVATAGVSGLLTCTINSVTLEGSSSTVGVTYSWSGPNAFTSLEQNPTVSVPGLYTLTVMNPSTGCTSSAQVEVEQDVTEPVGTAGVSGLLTCTIMSVTLEGSSSTIGVTYSWEGPGAFTSLEQNPVVSAPGLYTLTVTNPSTGCTSTAQVEVEQDVTEPGATAGVSGLLTCTTTSVTLEGSSSTSGVAYSWEGPNAFTSLEQNPVVSTPGLYTLTVTNPTTGCTLTAQVEVGQDVTEPGATAGVNGLLTCTTTSVTLEGASSTSGVAYSWEGPNAFTTLEQNPLVSVPGLYTLTVTNSSTGCTSTAQVEVEQDVTEPGATAGVSGLLTCTTTSVTLEGSSSTSGVAYSWEGPGVFTSLEQNPVVSTPGLYTLTVTNSSTGCTSTAQVEVEQDVTEPGATAGVSGLLTCTTTSVTLEGASSTVGVTYSWEGPNAFTSLEQNPVVSVPGLYTLTVTNPSTGCTSTAQVEVEQDVTEPGATAGVSGLLTCTTTSVTLEGASSTIGVTYSWEGPGAFTSLEQNPLVSIPGLYTL